MSEAARAGAEGALMGEGPQRLSPVRLPTLPLPQASTLPFTRARGPC